MLANSPSGPSKLRPKFKQNAQHAAKAFNAHCRSLQPARSYLCRRGGRHGAGSGRARGARRRAALPGSSGRGSPRHAQRPVAPKWGAGTKVVGTPRPYADRMELTADSSASPRATGGRAGNTGQPATISAAASNLLPLVLIRRDEEGWEEGEDSFACPLGIPLLFYAFPIEIWSGIAGEGFGDSI